MKKTLSIWLLVILFAPALITTWLLNHQKRQVKREVKWNIIASVEKDELVLLKFTKEDSSKLKWEHEREFEFQGEMYDVVEQIHRGDTMYYYCWWDYEETILNKQLQSLLAQIWNSNPEKDEQEDAIIAFYKSVFISSEPFEKHQFPEFLSHHTSYYRDYLNITSSPPIPPPELYR